MPSILSIVFDTPGRPTNEFLADQRWCLLTACPWPPVTPIWAVRPGSAWKTRVLEPLSRWLETPWVFHAAGHSFVQLWWHWRWIDHPFFSIRKLSQSIKKCTVYLSILRRSLLNWCTLFQFKLCTTDTLFRKKISWQCNQSWQTCRHMPQSSNHLM